MGIKGFERRLERAIEGGFARVFRSSLRPVELGRRLVREMDAHRSVDVRGRTVVPNHFVVNLSPSDHDAFDEVADTLTRELAEAAREHARGEDYHFLGRVEVLFTNDQGLRTGSFQIDARFKEGEGGTGPGCLVLPSGERVELTSPTVTIGRRPESTVVLSDPNVSRNHAEIRPDGPGWVLVDLDSTNGSRINGVRVQRQQLADGDELRFASTTITFDGR